MKFFRFVCYLSLIPDFGLFLPYLPYIWIYQEQIQETHTTYSISQGDTIPKKAK